MKYARILSIGLVVTVAFAWSAAAAVANARELADYCQSLERDAEGTRRQVYIPRTSEALTCWGYMQAMQDLSVLADEEGHRIMGACPPGQTTTLQLIQSFVRYARAHRTELQGKWWCFEHCEKPTLAVLSTAESQRALSLPRLIGCGQRESRLAWLQ